MTPDNKIKEDFLNHQQRYKQMLGDEYTASQFAATATMEDHHLTKEQLINKLNGK